MSEEYQDEQILYNACQGELAKMKEVGDIYTIGQIIRWQAKSSYQRYVDREYMKWSKDNG